MKSKLFALLFAVLAFSQCKKSEEEQPCGCGGTPILGTMSKSWLWEQSRNLTTNTVISSQSAGYSEKIVIKRGSSGPDYLNFQKFKNEGLVEELELPVLSKDEVTGVVVLKNTSSNTKFRLAYNQNDGKLHISETVKENENFTNTEEHIYEVKR